MSRLPVFGQPPQERADAARNRRRLLEAAERLFTERGLERVSMDDVAAAAGVGKGTLYRRFGDKAGLAIAVLDARERDLQEGVLRGPPPLGPGARPADRLHAFLDAYLDYLERNLDLVVMSETAAPGARYRTGVYGGWHWHVARVLYEAGVGDADVAAHLVLAWLDADLMRVLLADGSDTMVRRSIHVAAGALLNQHRQEEKPPRRSGRRR